ncbi:hypothetical protein CDAR_375461 [Caerostris darwini]|uniref:Reverse transcriptase domain-containing protein n=1 Tax=Caerostris darwini TaxID=1538125 RepID=A0AAV4S5Q7_9ARAC|nr:hypothetical protein CDAR_375461 [Caerostris darwini]
MNPTLSDYRHFSRVYIDDIAIFSRNFKKIFLKNNLAQANEFNYTVNLKKCTFARPYINILGQEIGLGRHQLHLEKVQAIRRHKERASSNTWPV